MYKGVEWKNQSSLFYSASSAVLCSVLKILSMLDFRDRAHPFIISKGACNISVAGCFRYILPTFLSGGKVLSSTSFSVSVVLILNSFYSV